MAHGFHWIGKSLDGKSITLTRFEGAFQLKPATGDAEIRTGVAIDVETTGLRKNSDAVIEIGLREFHFNRVTGEVVKIGESYSEFQDPGFPIPAEAQRVTGITDADVKDKQIDWTKVDAILARANIIMAHNAGFDRPFVEKKSTVSPQKSWACTLKQIDWQTKSYPSSKLEFLSIFHGFFNDAHRALADADTLIHLLTFEDPQTRRPYLNELLRNARRPMSRVVASRSPFESKDLLKERSYQWDAETKAWSRLLYKDELENEIAWLKSAVYKGEFPGQVAEIPITDHFKS